MSPSLGLLGDVIGYAKGPTMDGVVEVGIFEVVGTAEASPSSSSSASLSSLPSSSKLESVVAPNPEALRIHLLSTSYSPCDGETSHYIYQCEVAS